MPEQIPPIVDGQTQVGADFWLKAAHGSVRRFCGWHVAPVITETITLDGTGGCDLLVPSLRVVEVTRALNDDTDVTGDIDTSRAGVLRLQHGRWTPRLGRVSVTIRHGYDLEEVPELAALIIGLAKRGPQAGGIVASQSVNGASVSYATSGGAPISIPLLNAEKQALAPYWLELGTR